MADTRTGGTICDWCHGQKILTVTDHGRVIYQGDCLLCDGKGEIEHPLLRILGDGFKAMIGNSG